MDCSPPIETNITTPSKDTSPIQVENKMTQPIHLAETFRIPIGEPSTLPQAYFQEPINLSKLELLLNSNDNVLKEYVGTWGTLLKNERTHLQKLYDRATGFKGKWKGIPVVSYHFGKEWNNLGSYAGRVYPDGKLSLGCLRAELRGFLCVGEWTDIDLENAHPKALLQIFAKSGIRTPQLFYYVANRDECLRVLMDTLKTDDGEYISRKRAKNLFLRLTYGGSLRSWIEGTATDEENKQPPITNYHELPHETRKFLDAFEKETQHIILKYICDANPEIVAKYTRLKKRNPQASTASLFAQNLERKLLESLFEYCRLQGLTRNPKQKPRDYNKIRSIRPHEVILCFDGLMLRNEHIQRVGKTIPEVLREAEAFILDKTSFDMRLTEKPIDYAYSMDYIHANQIVEEIVKVYQNDYELMERLVELKPNYFKCHIHAPKDIYIYDETTGMWVNHAEIIFNYILSNRTLFPKSQDEKSKLFTYWGESIKSLQNALAKFHAFPSIRDDDWFLPRIQNSSLGKILLQDGYYDFDKDEFHEGFTPEIVFHHKANIPYNLEWDEEKSGFPTMEDCMEMLERKLAIDPAFDNNKTLKAMLHYLSRAIAGKAPQDRTFMMGTGATTAGKGTIADALKGTFGKYVAEINTPNLCPPSKNVDDFEKHIGFLVDKRFARILIAQEQPEKRPLASDLIKKLSGGDTLEGRKLYANSISFQPHGSLLLFNNSVEGAFDKVDDAVRIRIRAWNYDKTFVRDVKNPETQLPIDPDFKPKLAHNLYYQRAFFQLLLKYYHNPDQEALTQSKTLSSNISSRLDARSNYLTDHIQYTGEDDDFITQTDIEDIYDLLLRENDNNYEFKRLFKNTKALKKEIINIGGIPTNTTRVMEYRGRTLGKNTAIVRKVKRLFDEPEPEPEPQPSTPPLSGNGEPTIVRRRRRRIPNLLPKPSDISNICDEVFNGDDY